MSRAASASRAWAACGPQLLGVTAGRGLVLLVLREQADPLGGDRAGRLHPVAQALQAHEPVVGAGELGRGLGGPPVDVGEPLAHVGQGVLDGGPALDEGGFVGDLLLEHTVSARGRRRAGAAGRRGRRPG